MNIVYITPIYKPAVGGAAIYLDMMSRYLLKSEQINSFTVFTEKHPNSIDSFDERCTLVRLFPFRAGKSSKNFLSYLLYVIQNLQYFYLIWFLLGNKVDAVFVHSSLHNNPNLLYLVIRITKIFFNKTKYVLDVRDPKLPVKRLYQCRIYDRIISCSDNVTQHLKREQTISGKITEIAIPVEKSDLSKVNSKDVLNKYGLDGKEYLFNGSGCSFEKGVKRLVQIVKKVREDNDVMLVVAGKKRYWDNELEDAKNEGWLICAGELSHDEVMILSKFSLVDMNASSVDSMPRHSLEALINGSTILLPDNIPEFEKTCPDILVDYSSPEDVRNKLNKIITGEKHYPCSYDVTRHSPQIVFSHYTSLLKEIIK